MPQDDVSKFGLPAGYKPQRLCGATCAMTCDHDLGSVRPDLVGWTARKLCPETCKVHNQGGLASQPIVFELAAKATSIGVPPFSKPTEAWLQLDVAQQIPASLTVYADRAR
eukprot:SAG31_NODE_9201_length_1317_cov_1.240558_2_plen_110_part_01